jgi:hypothetical protein
MLLCRHVRVYFSLGGPYLDSCGSIKNPAGFVGHQRQGWLLFVAT